MLDPPGGVRNSTVDSEQVGKKPDYRYIIQRFEMKGNKYRHRFYS
jgi:hypothetical protein